MKKLIVIGVMILITLISGCATNEVENAVVNELIIDETISVLALGDNLLHMPVVNSGKRADGTYEYSHLFEKLQPQIKNADLSIIGQETVFGGEKFGYSGYPLFNSPSDMGKSLINEGFDVILHASNHVLDKWAEGVENTLDFWEQFPDVTVLGINDSEIEKQSVNIKTIKGAKIAVLNYTYGTNGLVLPQDKEHLVNYIDREKIEKDAMFAEDNADFTIAFMHWGTEYSIKPDEAQKTLAKDMCTWGVDLIIGSHPHVIEPVEWIESENGNKMLVYYSLGNFVSRQQEARNLLGAMADVKLKFDGKSVEISDYSFIPIVTHYDTNSKQFSVHRLKEYSDALVAEHGVRLRDGAVSVLRWSNMVKETFNGYDLACVDF